MVKKEANLPTTKSILPWLALEKRIIHGNLPYYNNLKSVSDRVLKRETSDLCPACLFN